MIREDLTTFFDEGPAKARKTARWSWLRRVLVPMALAHARHKGPRQGRREETLALLGEVAATDWRRAAVEWVERRHEKA